MGRGIGEGVLEQFCVEVKSDRRLRERSVKFAASRLEGRLR